METGDQSDVGGLLTRPRPDPEELRAQLVECLVQCSESLHLPATNLLEPGMEMMTMTNSHGSQGTNALTGTTGTT